MDDEVYTDDDETTEIDIHDDESEPSSKAVGVLVIAATAALAGAAGYFGSKLARRRKDVDLSEDETPDEETEEPAATTPLTVVEDENPE